MRPLARQFLRSGANLVALVIVSFLTSAVATQPAWACTVNMDAFTYADGSTLNGATGGNSGVGGSFSSAWTTDGGTPTDAFTIQNGHARVGDTGGADYRISRGIDLSGVTHMGCPPGAFDPTCSSSPISSSGTTFIYSQLAQIIDNHLPYQAAVEFSDAFGITAAFGIQNDGVDTNDYFFAELGNTRVVSNYAAQADSAYYLYGALSFDVNGGTDDLFRMWVNPSYSDFLNNINPTVEISLDLESLSGGAARTSLGDAMTLMANTQQAGTFKAFDDLQIARDPELLSAPRLDIGNGNTQIGFDEWTVGATPEPSFTLTFDQQTYYPSLPSAIATLTLEAIDAGESVLLVENSFGTPGYMDALRGDGVEAAGGIRLTFSGLHPDQYLIKTFHYQAYDNTEVDIYVSEDGGLTFALYTSFTPAGGTDAAREAMTFFETLSGDDIVIEFRPTVAGSVVGINGLQFVPEPGTALLLGLGLVGLGIRRRREGRQGA
ncbi:MAG: PEP-CTERM sorting domain-containing protein [Myxococcota bacterium]|nr:PEP-CTERM sorting domain-containing protein [Myxococcota bacterium]